MDDIFRYLKDNKNLLIKEKKATIKHADAICSHYFIGKKDKIIKSIDINDIDDDFDELHIKVIINTTNLLDSHCDVHMPNIWKKSLKDNKTHLLLQEHSMKFSNVISDSANAKIENYFWGDLGYKYSGITEALVFDAIINRNDNEYMFNLYKKGKVKNHSVGMQCVNLFLCINSDDKYYIEEKQNWDKYISSVANREAAEENRFFWAVTEAKIIEGSAVVKGSNYATPTLVVEPKTHSTGQIESHNSTLNIEELKQIITKTLKN